MKRLTARALIDDQIEYSFKSEVAIEKTKIATRYIPLVELRIPQKDPYIMRGNILYRPGKKIDIDMSWRNIFRDTVSVSGDVNYIKKRSRWQTNMALQSPYMTGSMEGYYERDTKGLHSSRLELKYQVPRQDEQRFTISNKFRNLSNRNRYQYSIDRWVAAY